jgi:hypothetical protein
VDGSIVEVSVVEVSAVEVSMEFIFLFPFCADQTEMGAATCSPSPALVISTKAKLVAFAVFR